VDVTDLVGAVKALVLRLARVRLVQFFALGTVIFAVARRGPEAGTSDIRIDGSTLAARRAAQAERTGVARLSPEDERAVDQRVMEDEVLVREAQRLGLDQDDALVRQHLAQKMLLLAEDLGGASRPMTDAELRAYYDETRDRRVRAASVRLVHAFARDEGRAATLAAQLASPEHEGRETPPPLGDAFPLPRALYVSREALVATYGEGFANAVDAAPIGRFSGPIASKLGFHAVKVLAREPGRAATFDEVRDTLRLEYAVVRRERAVQAFLARAAGRYRISVDGRPAAPLVASHRLGQRLDPSAED
jgi:hypothetical protein